ncbi:MAG TPA: hypothetical protein VGO47_14445 [Chlamydiales bacterium]|nr:hypothetical protein [Chlamydiales bacterium]
MQHARQLARAAKLVEQPRERAIGPFFRLPPFGELAFGFISGLGIERDADVHNREEKATPGNDGLVGLLVRRERGNEGGFVDFQDEVEGLREIGLLVVAGAIRAVECRCGR